MHIHQMNSKEILKLLPYEDPFLFVDELTSITENGVEGNYQFDENAFFYKGHFKNNPVTPGVILSEAMAQIGVVSLGIYLLGEEIKGLKNAHVALTSHQVDFYLPVMPGEKIKVVSEKEYFRFNKLKCKVKLFDSKGELACRGSISDMFKIGTDV